MKIFRLLPVIFLTALNFILMDSNAQKIKSYDQGWQSINQYMQKRLPASGLEVAKQIYVKAKAENEEAQIIKSLIYMTGLQQETRENNEVLIINELEKEISISKEPLASLLKSYLAGVYQNYLNWNRYKLYNRTQTVDFKKDDINTWTLNDFHKKISELYLQSVENTALLQATKLEKYDSLITKGNVRYLRPTLFDILAQRALNYFKSDERNITKPAYAFEITQPEAFAPAAEFAKFDFSTKDSFSLKQKALFIYQELIRFHLHDAKPEALIDADIARLDFVYKNSVSTRKDELYFNALTELSNKFPYNPMTDQARYLLARRHYEKGILYDANGDTSNRFEIKKAKELLDKILDTRTDSEGWTNAYNLRSQIMQPALQVQAEKVNVPGQPFRVLVSFKNLQNIYLRVIPATASIKSALKNVNDNNKFWDILAEATALKTWQQELPIASDLQTHRVEIKIDALPAGEYYILASKRNDFYRNKNIMAGWLTYISNISFVNYRSDFFVLDRNSGQPLPNAKVQVWQQIYDYKNYNYKKSKLADYVTDKNGYFSFSKMNEKNNRSNGFLFEIDYKNEKFFPEDNVFNYYYYDYYNQENNNKINTSVFLFTDRSLYRPGQTLYFKGIAINRQEDGKKSELNTSYKTTITLHDANGQKIDSMVVSANEYGSFSGKFTLPTDKLNGQFTLQSKDQRTFQTFRVEEYKRPKFYVEFEKLKGTYKINDDIHVSGFAKAYSGNNVDGAQVKYRVAREARFPYPWLFWRGWWPNTEPQEITHGETQTNAEGKFEIIFKALPDLKLDPKNEPVFDYKIYADITDINGEVRSGQEMVSVGYKSLILNTDLPERLAANELNNLTIHTLNMAGTFEKTNVKVVITRLKTENRLLRNRYWERPDLFVMTKEAYVKNFPNDIYDNENEPRTWEKGLTVLEQTGTTDSTGKFKLNKTNFDPGYYAVEVFTNDKEGNEVKDIKYIELFSQKQKEPVYPQYLFTQKPNSIEPGQTAKIEIGSSADNLFVIQSINKKGQTYQFIKLNNQIKDFNFSATEAERGGYGVNYMFVKNNRVFESNNIISVPWSNKDLKLEYTTFREKTLPGAEEKWTVKILGNKNEKVAAEMLAGMYDASLDQFYPHRWNKPALWYHFYNSIQLNTNRNFISINALNQNELKAENKRYRKIYDKIFDFGRFGKSFRDILNEARLIGSFEEEEIVGYGEAKRVGVVMAAPNVKMEADVAAPASLAETAIAAGNEKEEVQEPAPEPKEIQIRKNFNETAFFFPDLKTDKDGNISFSFTMPEALTRWKFQALAHTKELAMVYSSKEIVTQKELMVQPNAPRFLRQGDRVEFSSKIVNLSDKVVTGTATLQLFDASTDKPIDQEFKNNMPEQKFNIQPGQSQSVQFPIEIPDQFNNALTWRIIAKADPTAGTIQNADGEENSLPVLSNRMLVTESMPLNLRGSGTKKFQFEKLINSNNSNSLKNQSLTVEFTSNPAWYAVQALPYMMEYPYDCAEQTWNRYYANTLATMIANSSPKIKQVFEKWRTEDTAALLSNLEKNEELKAVLLEETPWVMQAKNETQQKKNIAVLFDLMRMSSELNKAYEKLRQMQSPNGGFVWFKGGPDDRFITQYIITGIGHLKKLNAVSGMQDEHLNRLLQNAMPYLDLKIRNEYEDLIKYKVDLNKYVPSYYVVQYLYMRSFFPAIKIPESSKKEVAYFMERSKKTWTSQNKYMQAMLALALNRNGDDATPKDILKSLKETSVNNEELGMYYKDNTKSWWWYDAPIERQALIVEAFEEINKDSQTADDLRTWLLKNKQTNHWGSTKSTAEAVYALLLRGSDWLTVVPDVTILLGSDKITSKEEKLQEGTGYMKKIIPGEKVKPTMGNVSVTVQQPAKSTLPTWGAVYWQYFEDLDKITFAETPLSLSKKLFVETNTDRGPVIKPINEGDAIKVGDKVKVRIELRVDRDMEYVHMKDMRASAFEPVNVLSSYKWQGGLGYYESTKDAGTNFFFNRLPKGTYVFEYNVFATMAGNFSNGVTTIQCMYAPEFTSHSEGIRVSIK